MMIYKKRPSAVTHITDMFTFSYLHSFYPASCAVEEISFKTGLTALCVTQELGPHSAWDGAFRSGLARYLEI